MKTDFDKAVLKLKGWQRQDELMREIAKRAEPLVKNLRQGKNYFTPDQYLDLINYLNPFDSEEIRARAIADGVARIGSGIELHRVKWLTEDRLFSITDLSRMTGIKRTTLTDKLVRLNLPRQIRGTKVLYDIDMLRDILETESGLENK